MPRTATTRDVAAALGLRPATVQSYARARRIPFDLTPGGHRRYDVGEVVAALKDERNRPEHQDPGAAGRHWLADATDLDGWARRYGARSEFPDVVMTLIERTTLRLRKPLRGRGGEGVDLPGWDILVEAEESTLWVPEGRSAWELSTSEATKSKANADFRKRTDDPLGLDPQETALVLCFLRRCSWKEAWVSVKQQQGPWREVRVYDADDLARWLAQAPEVHTWVTRLVGREPAGVADLSTAWARWSAQTVPPLPQEMFVEGREDKVKELNERLQGDPAAVAVKGDSEDESLAFTLAALRALDASHGGGIQARTLVVQTQEAWDKLTGSAGEPLILVARFDPRDVLEATDAGHHVVIPAGPGAVGGLRSEPLAIPRLRRSDVRTALGRCLPPDHDPDRLATTARRSLPALRRQLAVHPRSARPPWTGPEHAPAVLTALLAGSWRDDGPGDREALARLARRPYEDLTEHLATWRGSDDCPVRRVGQTWYVADADDALILLQQAITGDRLVRFRTVALEVLSEVDPALELAGDQRWAAALYGRTRRWSGQLRAGIAGTLALLATRVPDEDLGGRFTGRSLAEDVVGTVLDRANADEGGRLWSSLSDVLPELAEAAPETFLHALHAGVRSPAPLSGVFDPEAETSPLGRPTHTGLLWALERLAWSVELFEDTVLLLGRLAQVDPGGQWANRPAESLRDIFLPWRPHTAASLELRLQGLDRLRDATPEVSWTLMRSLLPAVSDGTAGTDKPRWRDWAPEGPEASGSAIHPQLHATHVVRRMVADAGRSGERWGDLIEHLGLLLPDEHELVLQGLSGFEHREASPGDRERIASALRREIGRHRRFPDAEWALPAERVAALEPLLEQFDDADNPLRHAWLFSAQAHLPAPAEDWESEQEALRLARREAVTDILEQSGLDTVWQLAKAVEAPDLLGLALGEVTLPDDDSVLVHLASENGPRRSVADAFVSSRLQARGWEWARNYWDVAAGWGSDKRAAFLSRLPPHAEVLDWAEQDDRTAQAYWRGFRWAYLPDPEVLARVVDRLREHGRADVAVGVLSSHLRGRSDGPDVDADLIADTLRDVPTYVEQASDLFAYDIARLLAYLADDDSVERSVVAALEWQYLLVLESTGHQPRALHEALASEPSLFVTVVKWVYGPDDESEEPTGADDEEQQQRAQLGYRLLHAWGTVPGSGRGGIDADRLREWVRTAREELLQCGRRTSGDYEIGRVLRYAPEDPDGTWPPAAVRRLLEDAPEPLRDVEEGLETQVYNDPTGRRRVLQGGSPPARRALARRYAAYANKLASADRRTVRLLRRIAERFERDARWAGELEMLREDLER